MPSDNNQEMFPVVDEQGNITGAATRGECHSGSRLLHPVVQELGITDFTPELLTHYVFESEREKELVFVHKTVYDGEIHPSDELDGGRFWTVKEIKENLGKGIFTPNFEEELKKVSLISSLSK